VALSASHYFLFSYEMSSLKVPLRVIAESTSCVGRSGRGVQFLGRRQLVEICFLFHRFLFLDDSCIITRIASRVCQAVIIRRCLGFGCCGRYHMENSTKHTCSESILIERSSVTWYCATEVMMAEKPSSFTFGEFAREPL